MKARKLSGHLYDLYTRRITDRNDDVLITDKPLSSNCSVLFWKRQALWGIASGRMFNVTAVRPIGEVVSNPPKADPPDDMVFMSSWIMKMYCDGCDR